MKNWIDIFIFGFVSSSPLQKSSSPSYAHTMKKLPILKIKLAFFGAQIIFPVGHDRPYQIDNQANLFNEHKMIVQYNNMNRKYVICYKYIVHRCQNNKKFSIFEFDGPGKFVQYRYNHLISHEMTQTEF